MEPEETVTALKIRERVRGKKEREEDRGRKGRRVEKRNTVERDLFFGILF